MYNIEGIPYIYNCIIQGGRMHNKANYPAFESIQ